MEPTLISYSRVSSAKQLSGTGLEQQKDAETLNKLSEKYGLPVDKRTFSDEGLSGYHGHNLQGEFGKILELISTGSIVRGSILVITSLDRLSRAKANEAMELMLSVINRGIRIYTAMDEKLYSSDSPNLTADLIVSVIIMAQAHEESLKKSKRTIGSAIALIDRFYKGERASDGNPFAIKSVGKAPWFIDVSGDSVKPHEYFFPVAKWMVQQLLNGKGTTRLVNELNESYEAPNKVWSHSMVQRFSSSEALIGKAIFNIAGNQYELDGYYPRLMTDDEFYQIKARKKQATHSRTSKSTQTILSGLKVLKCRECGGSLSYTSASKYNAYRCINGMRSKAKCSGMSVPAYYVDEIVTASLNWFTLQPKPAIEDLVTPAQMKLEKAQSELNQIEEDYLDSPSGVLARLLNQKEQEVDALKVALEHAKMNQQVDSFIGNEELESTNDYRQAISRSIDSIRVHKVANLKALISIYFKTGINKHVLVHKGNVVQSGSFYFDPEKEKLLKDKNEFLLFVADGRLNQWIDNGVLDTPPEDYDYSGIPDGYLD
ncbi:TPA: recombinase family protein [Vibrio parahaemolyticus]